MVDRDVVARRILALSEELARRLASAACLGNVLVHDHVSVDLERLARVVREDPDDLRLFAARAATLLAD